MSRDATRDYIRVMRKRYKQMKTKRAKTKLLDEFCELTGFERKHAIKTLRSRKSPLQSTGRKSTYAEASPVLREIWLLFDQPCSKLLHPVMSDYVKSYERNRGPIDDSIRSLLLQMSPSTIDRLLQPHRVRSSLWRGRGSPLNAIKQKIEVRTEGWRDRGPGWCETDSVAHCGGSMAGSFAHTLTFSDTASQWTEMRAVWNRGAYETKRRIAEIELELPFAILGTNSDNGGEFINHHLLSYFQDRDVPVVQTRSRPYHKNDNAHVEQKNGSLVRSLLGYDRFDDRECIEPLNEILKLHSLWTNLFRPCMRLIEKHRDGRKYIKKYDTPLTPAQRLLQSDFLSEESKQHIQALREAYDCYQLKIDIKDKLDSFLSTYAK